MSSSHAACIHSKWDSWLDRIDSEISQLYQDRRIYLDLIEIIEANPRINGGNWLYVWMFGNYAQAAAASIRRLLDKPGRSDLISLRGLIESMCEHPELIVRRDFVARYQDDPFSGNKDFDELAGLGQILDPAALAGRLEQAEALCKGVRTYVDKVVAHSDRRSPDALPTYKEIDQAIEAVGALFRHVYALLRCATRLLEITLADPWQWVLDEPWVRQQSPHPGNYPDWSDWANLDEHAAESAPEAVFSVIRIRVVGQDGKPEPIEHPEGTDSEGIVFIGASGLEKGSSRASRLSLYLQALQRAVSEQDAEWEGPKRLCSLWRRIDRAAQGVALQVQYLPLNQYLQAEAIEMRARTEYREKFGHEPEQAWLENDDTAS